MTCEEIREELVAYQDGELAERDRKQVAAHLNTCSACTQEAVSLARVGQMFSGLEQVTPAPDFAANFWRRLEQEREAQPENWFAQWWRELQESITNWHLTPALVAVSSVLIFFAAFAQRPDRTAPSRVSAPPVVEKTKDMPRAIEASVNTIPAEVTEKTDLFVDYKIIAELDKFARFEEIAAVDLPTEQSVEVAETDVPKEVLDDPGFFAHYQILQQLERLENFDAVLASPSRNEEETQG